MEAHLGEGLQIDLPHDILFQLLQRVAAIGAAPLRALVAKNHPLLEASLLHEPNISVKWQQSAKPAPLLPAYMRTTLLARESPLRLAVTKVAISNDAGRFATAVAKGLGVCRAVQHLSLREACPFASIQQWPPACTDLLATNYPGLTQLSLSCLTLPAPALHSLLSHPQLTQRLRQLSLDQVTLVQGDSSWQDTMFDGSQLNQLSLAGVFTLPCLAPLALYLMRFSLHLHGQTNVIEALATLRPPPQLRVLELDGPDRQFDLGQPELQQLLQVLPNLQELLMPHVVVSGTQTLDALLAATQLTRLSVQAFTGVTKSRARAKCSWRLLELCWGNKKINCLDWVSAAHLPLHSLTQPLALGFMWTSLHLPPGAAFQALADAVHNVAMWCEQEVQIRQLDLEAENMPVAPLEHAPQPSHVPLPDAGLQPAGPLPATPQPQRPSAVVHQLALLKPAVVHVRVVHLPSLMANSLQVVAPVCQKTKVLSFVYGALDLHVKFWTALQQLMPSVECVNLWEVQCDGAALMEGLGQLSNQAAQPAATQLIEPAATHLTDLPIDILFQLLQRVTADGPATLRTLAATCHHLLEASLLHEPSISAKWQQSARNAPLLPAYMRTTLLARESPLRLAVTKVAISNDAGRFATAVAKGLGVCRAVQHLSLREACPFASIQQWPPACTDLLATNYPGLTQLSLSCLTLPAPALHSLLSHPQLTQRLRQLSLDQVTLVQGNSSWQDTMFDGSQLNQLSLANVHTLPCLAPLALYLMRFSLHLHGQTNVIEALATLRPPPQLRVLELDGPDRQLDLGQPGLQKLLQDLPNLQELVTPSLVVSGMQTLDALLAATQLTRLSVQAFTGVTKSRARAKCSWRLLELRFGNKKNICLDWVSAAHLPLRSLTQPLSVCYMCTSLHLPPGAAIELLAAAVHNMAACCGQEVRIRRLDLEAENMPVAPLSPAPQPSQVPLPDAGLELAGPLPATPPPQRPSAVVHQLALWKPAVVHVRVADLPSLTVSSLQALAPVCHKTKVLSFVYGALELHLEFWTALQQLMPSVECVNLWEVQCDGAALMEGLGQLSNQVGVRPLTVQLGAGTGKGVCSQKTVFGVVTVLPGDPAQSQES